MSKKRLLLASAVLSVATLAASCGGGGGGGTASATTTTPPPSTTTTPPPQATLLSTVLVQVSDISATSFARRLVEVYSDGSAKVNNLSADAATPNALGYLSQCPNGNIILNAPGVGLYFYNKANNSITKLAAAPGIYNVANVNANFVVLDNPALLGAPAEVIVTCNGAVVDFTAKSSALDKVFLTDNYVIYLDERGGVADDLYVVRADGSKNLVGSAAVAVVGGLELNPVQAQNNPNVYVVFDNNAVANANYFVIRQDGTVVVGQSNLSALGNPIVGAVAIQVGNNIYTGLRFADAAAAPDVELRKDGALVGAPVNSQHNCDVPANIALDGTGNLYCADEANNTKVAYIKASGVGTGTIATAAANTVDRFIGVVDGVVLVDTVGSTYVAHVVSGLQTATPAVASAAQVCFDPAGPLVLNQGTSNVVCALGTTAAPVAGLNFAVIASISQAVSMDVDGTPLKTSGVAQDAFAIGIFGGNYYVFGNTTNKVLHLCQADGLNSSCKALTNAPYNVVLNTPDAITRRQNNGMTRLYPLAAPTLIDLVNDTVKTYPVNTIFALDPHVRNDLSMMAVLATVADVGNSCTVAGLANGLQVGELAQTSPVVTTKAIFGATTPVTCINSILGVF